jgi:hypothetical protein
MSTIKKYGVDFGVASKASRISERLVKNLENIEYDEYLDKKAFHGACTLDSNEVKDDETNIDYTKIYTKTHSSGWTISGRIHDDYFQWVNEFYATHPIYGTISGDFESKIYILPNIDVNSENLFNDFWENHTPNIWDYMDI